MPTICCNASSIRLITLPKKRPFSGTNIYKRELVPMTKIRALRRDDGYDHRSVDESMIVLRMRIKEMKMAAARDGASDELDRSEWMEWERKYYPDYNSDVVQVVGMLQSYLIDTRPSVALAMALLVMLSVSTSVVLVGFNFVEVVKGVLS